MGQILPDIMKDYGGLSDVNSGALHRYTYSWYSNNIADYVRNSSVDSVAQNENICAEQHREHYHNNRTTEQR